MSDLDLENMSANRNTPVMLYAPRSFSVSRHIAKKRIANDRRRNKYDDDVRKKIETARARLGDSKSHPIVKTISMKSKRESSVTNSANDFPIIYFVVASNKIPCLSNELSNQNQRLHQRSYAQRERKAFFADKVLHKKRMLMEKKRIKDLGAHLGLRLEPKKVIAKKDVVSCNSRLNTTPVSMLGKSDYKEDQSVLNYSDDFELKQTPQISVDDCKETIDQNEEHTETNVHNTVSDDVLQQSLELPVIGPSNLDHTKQEDDINVCTLTPSPEGSVSTLKKVHFAEGLPEITGNKINLIRSETESEISRDIQRLKKSSSFASISTPYNLTSESSNLTRSTSEMTPRSRVVRLLKPMSLPKIDVLSPIYDELLLKTLETYCMNTDGVKPECDANSIICKMSAIFHPEHPHPEWQHFHPNVSRSRQSINRRVVEPSADFVTKTESNKSELSLKAPSMEVKDDGILSSMSAELRTISVAQTSERQAAAHTPVNSACFRMIPPGLTKERSLSFQTLVVQTKDN